MKPQSFVHVSKFDAAGIMVPWQIHPHDMVKIRAQILRNPGAAWPSRLASEWDLTEDTARRIIREVLR